MERRIETSDPRATQRLFGAMALSLAIYATWIWFRGPAPVEPEATPVAVEGSAPAPATPLPVPAVTVTPLPPVRELPFSACALSGQWTTDGGSLRDVTLASLAAPLAITPIWTWVFGFGSGVSSWPWVPYGGDPGPARLLGVEASALAAATGPANSPAVRFEALESGADHAAFRGWSADGVEIVHRVTAGGEPCVLTSEITWKNVGSAPYAGGLDVRLHDRVQVASGGWFSGPPTGQQVVALIDGSLTHPTSDDMEAAVPAVGPVDWFGLSGHAFGVLVLPEDRAAGQVVFSRRGEPADDGTALVGATWWRSASLAPGESYTARFRTYGGKLDRTTLEAVHPTLPEIINYGWMAAFATPMLWALELLYGWLGNWGVAIIALTVAIKILLFPLITTGMKSSMKMAALQPKLQEIREKYKNEPEEMNKRTMALFSEGGANPLGGCLPLLAQIPVFASLYGVLLMSADLYQGEFLYLRDLSGPDPYGLLPVGTIALMWGQQQLMPMTNIDPAQQQILKLMPFLFGLFFFTAPSGLGVYMLVNIGLSILQQWWIKRQFPQPTPASAPA